MCFQVTLNGSASAEEKVQFDLYDEFQEKHSVAMNCLKFWVGNALNCWMEIYGDISYPNSCGEPRCVPAHSFPNSGAARRALPYVPDQ